MRTAGTTETEVLSGHLVELLRPDDEDVDLFDMVTSLARTCRFNGNTPVHYSNAQHSIIVANLLDDEDRIHGLLHDAPEYLLGDMTSPVKQALGWISPDFPRAWRYLEGVAERAIYSKAGVPLPSEEARARVKRADLIALAIEQREVLRSPNHWNLPYAANNTRIVPADAEAARAMFVDALAKCGVTVKWVRH